MYQLRCQKLDRLVIEGIDLSKKISPLTQLSRFLGCCSMYFIRPRGSVTFSNTYPCFLFSLFRATQWRVRGQFRASGR